MRSGILFACGAVALACWTQAARGEDKVAWMLQTNLLEKSEAVATANLPNVLILGDSISMGYTPFVKKRLAGIANVSRPARNCQATQAYLAPRGGMRDWVGTNRWDVITVNAGIWDICYMKGDPLKTDHYWGADAELGKLPPLARGTAIRDRGFHVRTPILEYQANLRKILTYLKSTGATVLFPLTTPVPAYENDDRCGLFRAYNEIAVGVCAELGVRTVDLYAVAERHYDLMKDRCHFNDEGNDLLAGVLCNEIRAALRGEAPDRVEPPYAFRARFDQVHEPNLRDSALKPNADEFAFADGCAVGDADFADYLLTSMGVTCAAKGPAAVRTELGRIAKGYEIDVDAKGVRISAADARMLRQAYYHLEDLMSLRRAPFLTFGHERRVPLFTPRIIHSGWGFDEFSDNYLLRAAHNGFDAISFYVWNADEPRAKEIRDLIRRARARELDSYLYSRVNTQAFVHPDDPKAEATFDATYGRMAAAFPEAKGVLLVGESLEFPSKDERSCGLAIDYAKDRRRPGDTRPYVGWFPCRDYPQLVEAIKKSMRKVNPNLEVVLWSYNWGYCEEGPRRELIAHLPKDVPLLVTYEMFESYNLRNGLPVKIADYSVAFKGPGRYFVSEAEEAKARGLKLYAMANTACRTWDLGLVPYLPVPYQWKRRWDGMKAAQGRWGLCGVVDGHHFGWAPNFVSELCKEAFTEGGMDFDTHIRRIAVRDFGEANADAALAAWRQWSEAMRDTNPSAANQNSAYRYGPAYPFNALRPDVKATDLSLSPMFMNPNYRSFGSRDDQTDDYLRKEADLLDTVVARWLDGAAAFRRMGGEKARAMARLGEYVGRCYLTAANVKRGLLAERAKDETVVLALAKKEYENVCAARRLVLADSSLGYEPRVGYRGDERALRMKMKWMERAYFGGEQTVVEPYPELDVKLVGQTLTVSNRSDRDFESGGLVVCQLAADGRQLGEVRLKSPALARGRSGTVTLPFDPAAVPGLARLQLSFEQFEYGTVIVRDMIY